MNLIYQSLILLSFIVIILSFSINDEDCINKLSNDVKLHTIDNFKFTIINRYFDCANNLLTYLQNQQIDVKNVIDLEYNTIVKNFEKLRSNIKPKEVNKHNGISPSFQWAQSVNDVFINVKFAHKIDAPATLNVEPSTVNITDNAIYLEASDGKKFFALDIQLYDKIIPDNSTYSLGSVGRMTFQLKKSTNPSKWIQLLSKNHRKINNMHFWWEYHEKFVDELEEFDEFMKKLAKEKKNNETLSNNNTTITTNTTNTTSISNTTTISNATSTISKDKTNEVKKSKEDSLIDIELKKIDIDIKNKIIELDNEFKEKRKQLNDEYKSNKDLLEEDYQSKKKKIESDGKDRKISIKSVVDMEL